MEVAPNIAKRYKAVRTPQCTNLYERFKKADGEFFSQSMGTMSAGRDILGAKGFPLKEVLKDIKKKQRYYKPQRALEELERRKKEVSEQEAILLLAAQGGNKEDLKEEEFRKKFFETEENRIKFFKDLDFNHAKLDQAGKIFGSISIDTQKLLLSYLKGQQLNTITLNNCQAFDASFLKELQLQNVTYVSLKGCDGVTSQVPTYLSERCTQLTYLDLSRSANLTYVAGGVITSTPLPFPNLKKFAADQCPKLNEINIQGDNCNFIMAKENLSLSKLKIQSSALKVLNINKNPKITDQILDNLGKTCPHLEVIAHQGCLLLSYIDGIRNWSFAIQKKLAQDVRKKIKEVYERQLISLNLNEHSINDENIQDLTYIFEHNKSLKSLHLSWNKIGNTGVATLAKALKSKNNLTELHLNGNNIEDQGVIKIAEMLKDNAALITLNLERNLFRDEGVKALAESLKFNSSLTELKVGEIVISKETAESFLKMLQHNNTLTKLSLYNNSINQKLLEWHRKKSSKQNNAQNNEGEKK